MGELGKKRGPTADTVGEVAHVALPFVFFHATSLVLTSQASHCHTEETNLQGSYAGRGEKLFLGGTNKKRQKQIQKRQAT